ncbi:MAG: glycosyltransferase [Clostridia bacterium]|nr:glycosyltransferase [Clostridia bacterium]
MLDFIISGIIWTLALYGLIEIIKTIYYICTCTKLESNGIYFIIAVKNQQEKIEGFMRSILFRIVYGKEDNVKDIIITDLGSTDNTRDIIQKLQSDYKFINLVDWKTCKELIDNIGKK